MFRIIGYLVLFLVGMLWWFYLGNFYDRVLYVEVGVGWDIEYYLVFEKDLG